MEKFSEKDIPKEVVWYTTVMMATGGMMSKELYDKCKKIIKNYPKWFPWEAKYDTIPSEVHEAYRKEKFPDWDSPVFKRSENSVGILEAIRNHPVIKVDYPQNFSFIDALKELQKDEIEKRKRIEKQKAEDKLLWDKHYSKYKLPFRD